jgi:hypothetical protein
MRRSNIPSQRVKCDRQTGTRVQKPISVKSEQSLIFEQIEGFTRCLQIWFDKEFKKAPNQSVICRTLTKNLSGIPLNKLPKAFKGLLCYNFSLLTSQELPDVDFDMCKIPIWKFFAKHDRNQIQARLTSTKRVNRKLITLWSLLQSKVLASKVPESFSNDALAKHRETVGKEPSEIPVEVLHEIRDFIRPFVIGTVDSYLRNPKTKIPNQHSCIESKRKDGGNLGWFKENKCFTSSLYRSHDRSTRFDPVVVHLEGPAGRGKSTMTKLICKKIEQKFGIVSLPSEGMGREVYSRSAKTDHWDGYKQQLISIVDDFGFEGNESIAKDIQQTSFSEIIQMCSDVDYVLPMADLKDKGTKFSSKFLLLSSNRATQHIHGLVTGIDKYAIARRISPTYRIRQDRLLDKFIAIPEVGPDSYSQMRFDSSILYNSVRWERVRESMTVDEVVSDAMETYDKRLDFFYSQYRPEHSFNWKQPICTEIGATLALKCRNSPPKRIPYVSASVVQDPLKARIITIPSGDCYCLKPVQLAMMTALKGFSCFEPCWHPEYDLSQLRIDNHEDYYLLSGDYSSATDGLNYHVSQVVIDELAKAFHPISPQISEWIRHEGGQHIVVYPKKSGCPDVLQTNGQLMGSLLSFPILTILNAFTLCKATSSSLETVRGLFHGDDIAAYVTKNEYNRWASIANQIGLELSVGKNYFSKDFVSIDSQLFLKTNGQFEKQKTGKLKLVYRSRGDIPTCRRAIEEGFSLQQIRRYAPDSLRESVKSLRIPEEYGGLGKNFAEGPTTLHERLVYLAEVSIKCSVSELSHGIFRVEKSVADRLKLRSSSFANLQEPSEDNHDRKLRMMLSRLHRRMLRSTNFSSYVKTLDLSSQRPLTSICPVIVRCDDHSKESLSLLQSSILGNPINPRPSLRQLQRRTGEFANPVSTAGKWIGPMSLKMDQGSTHVKKANLGTRCLKFLRNRVIDASQIIFD